MTSFISKRAQRATKASKSFILENDATVHQEVSKAPDFETSVAEVQPETSSSSVNSEAVSHPGLYLDLPSTLEIRRDSYKNRGVYSKNSFKRGSILFVQRPPIISLSNQHAQSYCNYCAVSSTSQTPLKRCPKCKTLRYCSSECQNLDWSIHKHECGAICKWANSSPDGNPPGEAVRTLGRMLLGRKVHGPDSPRWKEILALQSHRSSLPNSSLESYTNLAHSLVRYLNVNSPDELVQYGLNSAGDIVDLISKFTTNTFTLTSSTLLPLGSCVCPIAALFNHSCRPNAVIVFPAGKRLANPVSDPALYIIAIQDIEPGQEVLTSYVDTTLPTTHRQATLQETFNFVCLCPVCSGTDKAVDPRETVLCPQACGGLCAAPLNSQQQGFILMPWRCTSCKATYTPSAMDDINDKRRLGQDALDKASKIQFSDPSHALKLTTNMSLLLSPHLPPSSHPLLGLLRLQQPLLIDSLSQESYSSALLDDTIRAAARVVSGLSVIFDKGHPVRGIALAELGKLLAVDEPAGTSAADPNSTSPSSSTFPPTGPPRLALAFETLKNALEELMIGFGEATKGGEVGIGIREELVSLEKEMSVWREGIRNTRTEALGALKGNK